MSSILEKALTYLLNEEQEKAEQLFHQFIIERARQIHESLRQGEDKVLDENWEQEIAENYFAEDDLTDMEDGEDEMGMGDEMGDEMGDGMGGDEMGDDMAGDQMGDDMGMGDEMGAEGEEGSMEERIADLESKLEQLQQEFETLSGEEETEHGMDFDNDGMVGDETGEEGGEFGDEMGSDMSDNMADGEEELEDNFNPAMRMESEEEDDDDKDDLEEEFDDITESIVNELEKVSVQLEDGKTIAAGAKFQQQTESPMVQRGVDDRVRHAKPVVTGLGPEHEGYDREAAPDVKDTKFYSKVQNTKRHAEDGRQRMSKEGDKNALINDLSSESGNLRSPIGSKGSVGKNAGFA